MSFTFCIALTNAQDAGAIALLIVDSDGQCKNLDQSCLPGAEKARNEGFAAADLPSQWYDTSGGVFDFLHFLFRQGIYIPIAFLLRDASIDLFGDSIAQGRFDHHHTTEF